jgi:phage-related protein
MGNPENQAKISKFLDNFGGAAFMVGDLLANLDGLWHKGVTFVNWIKSAYTNVKDFFVNLPGTISGFFTWLGNELGALPGRVWAWLQALPNLVWQIFTAAMSNMAYLVGWGIRQVGTFLINLPGNVWAWLKSLPGLVASIISSAVAWFRNFGPQAFNAARNVGSYVASALSNLPRLMWNAGYNAVLGIWNGITSLAGWLWSKVQNLGVSMWNAFMRGIGAASPSRKFAEAGKWAVLGAAQGLDAHAPALMTAAQNLANGLAGTKLALPGVDGTALSGQLTAAANGTISVQAAKRTQRVQVDLNVIGSDGMIKTALQKLNRTSNLKLT